MPPPGEGMELSLRIILKKYRKCFRKEYPSRNFNCQLFYIFFLTFDVSVENNENITDSIDRLFNKCYNPIIGNVCVQILIFSWKRRQVI